MTYKISVTIHENDTPLLDLTSTVDDVKKIPIELRNMLSRDTLTNLTLLPEYQIHRVQMETEAIARRMKKLEGEKNA